MEPEKIVDFALLITCPDSKAYLVNNSLRALKPAILPLQKIIKLSA
jgi:hypothetical protein